MKRTEPWSVFWGRFFGMGRCLMTHVETSQRHFGTPLAHCSDDRRNLPFDFTITFMYKCCVPDPNTDKRRRERPFPNGIELFLLLMISRRVDSLYEIRQKTGINPGAISHAIARLQKKEAITWAPEGYRRKRKLTVTQEGHKVLRNNWPNALEEAIDGPQVLARAALIALMKHAIGEPSSGAAATKESRRHREISLGRRPAGAQSKRP